MKPSPALLLITLACACAISSAEPRGAPVFTQSKTWLAGAPSGRNQDPAYARFRGSPDVAARPTMIYGVGVDGFLHGVDAHDGVERLTYVPRGVAPSKQVFPEPDRDHRRLANGSPVTGDADIRGIGTDSRWATVLVAWPGADVKGFAVLDASRPGRFSQPLAAESVLLDTTTTRDADIGHIVADSTGSSQITQLNNGRWAVLMGNGIHSANEMPVLLLQYLDGPRELSRLAPACPVQPKACEWRGGNGLATPTTIDIDGDGKTDIAYAGDLLGHVWKYDLSDRDADKWRVAFDDQPLFTARDEHGRPQAITSAPAWTPHPAGGVMLAIGTGRLLDEADDGDTHVQSLYGLLDDSGVRIEVLASAGKTTTTYVSTHDGVPINTSSDARRPENLRAQHQLPGESLVQGHTYYRTTGDPTHLGIASPRGWYFDLPAPSERVLQAPAILAGTKAVFRSTDRLRDYLTVLNLITGDASVEPVFAALVASASSPDSGIDAQQARMTTRVAVDTDVLTRTGQGEEMRLIRPKVKPKGLRAGWRQWP